MTIGPLQQHDSRFRDRNLPLLALLGLLSYARRSRWLLEARTRRLGSRVRPQRSDLTPRSLLLALGVVSFGRTIERHITALATEKPLPYSGSHRSRTGNERPSLRALLR
jgi:hypothetical protein